MILVGGPVANIIRMELNPHLAVDFDWKQVWRMESSRTRRPYADEQVGLVAKVRNPWNPARVIVVLSGLHAVGTMAAILGLTHFAEEVLDGYAPGEDFYRVVAGPERGGHGRVDAVAILPGLAQGDPLVRDLVLAVRVCPFACLDGPERTLLPSCVHDGDPAIRRF